MRACMHRVFRFVHLFHEPLSSTMKGSFSHCLSASRFKEEACIRRLRHFAPDAAATGSFLSDLLSLRALPRAVLPHTVKLPPSVCFSSGTLHGVTSDWGASIVQDPAAGSRPPQAGGSG